MTGLILESELATAPAVPLNVRPRSSVADYLQLSKARIVAMVLVTTAAGFIAAGRQFHWLSFLQLLAGTAMVAAGTNALNQYFEREADAKMHRTRRRPIPGGRISPAAALIFSWSIAVAGSIYLYLAVNPLTALLGAITLLTYVFLYTPLKRFSTLCTLVGAIPGAIPPMMGWSGATGRLDAGGWILFGILFLWQLPHFLAISWIYREDYGLGGFAMLSTRDHDGRETATQARWFAAALFPVTLAPVLLKMAGPLYLAAALVSTGCFFAVAVLFRMRRDIPSARRLFMTSNIYLLAIMTAVVIALH